MNAAKLVAPDLPVRLPQCDGVERFRASLTALVGAEAVAEQRFGVALSGGPDSVALLLLAAAAVPDRVVAATVDHRLRAASAEEAQWCRALCDDHGIPHEILTAVEEIGGNIQSQARRVRYALLDQWLDERQLDAVFTAHHADDQAETLLMRLNRGAGVAGLAGVRAINGRVVRPLLTWRRAELAAIVASAGIAAINDPSNHDPAFDRVRMREALADAAWLDRAAMGRSAHNLADSEAALVWMTDRLAAEAVDAASAPEITVTCSLVALPRELARRLLLHALAAADPDLAPRGDALDRLLAHMIVGEKSMIGNLTVTPTGSERWRILPAPPRTTKEAQ